MSEKTGSHITSAVNQGNNGTFLLQELYDMFTRFTVGQRNTKSDIKLEEQSQNLTKAKQPENSARRRKQRMTRNQRGLQRLSKQLFHIKKIQKKIRRRMNVAPNDFHVDSKKYIITAKETENKPKTIEKENNIDTKHLENIQKLPQTLMVTTDRVLKMAEATVHVSEKLGSAKSADSVKLVVEPAAKKERTGLEMMKVKKAEADPKKKADLEQELIKDYPVSGSVEITNWQGTFAPIVGDPYVAPVHQQPDSFWDAIYRSTDPDLPTPPGVVSAEGMTPHPDSELPYVDHTPSISLKRFAEVPSQNILPDKHFSMINEVMQAKNKDKGKKEKKKPKLSPKEKKKKKQEKKQNTNNFARPPGNIKVSPDRHEDSLRMKPEETIQISIATPNHDQVQHHLGANQLSMNLLQYSFHSRFNMQPCVEKNRLLELRL